MVETDSNEILFYPIKSCNDAYLTRSYQKMVLRLRRSGIIPKKHILDNEVSEALKTIIQDEYKMQMELVPPGTYHWNAEEVAIRNFKARFLIVLAGTSKDFPPALWDRLLPQAEITIKLLRQYNSTPNVLAYAHLSRPFDYNKIPLAPMGMSVQVYEKIVKRGTWAYHTVESWYLLTSNEHYRTHRCHIKSTSNKKFKYTVHFGHREITQPTITHADKVMAEISDCAKAIKNLGNGNGSDKMQQLVRITERAIHYKPYIAETPTTTVCNPASLRVTLNNSNNNSRQTRSMTQPNQQLSAISTPVVPRVEQSTAAKHKIRKNIHKPTISTTSQAQNTRSRTHREKIPPSRRIKAHTRITRMVNKKQTDQSSTEETTITQLENYVHQALAAMDEDTVKLLNYRQLMRNPKLKKIGALHLQMNLDA